MFIHKSDPYKINRYQHRIGRTALFSQIFAQNVQSMVWNQVDLSGTTIFWNIVYICVAWSGIFLDYMLYMCDWDRYASTGLLIFWIIICWINHILCEKTKFLLVMWRYKKKAEEGGGFYCCSYKHLHFERIHLYERDMCIRVNTSFPNS